MRVVTLYGTRPELIRLSRLLPLLDERCEHTTIHTGQNYDDRLNRIFFDELSLRAPDHQLEARGSFAEQAAIIFPGVERILAEVEPERFVVLGDTNSSLGAVVAKRMGIPVYHLEAGNRSHDQRTPEEVNRRIIDHCSDVHMPYTERSRQNLLAEGVPARRTFVIGNPIAEVLHVQRQRINQSDALHNNGVQVNGYVLATIHRAENVDDPKRLLDIVVGLEHVSREMQMPVLVSVHPHTRLRLDDLGACETQAPGADIRWCEPFGFLDFAALETNAALICTDSGTVQEESAILGTSCVVLRDATERPETIECGATILSKDVTKPQMMARAMRAALRMDRSWPIPEEYTRTNVAQTAANIILGGPVL